MNIVKGVADLIRRSSGGHPGESSSVTHVERFSAPSPKICFRYLLVTNFLHLITLIPGIRYGYSYVNYSFLPLIFHHKEFPQSHWLDAIQSI